MSFKHRCACPDCLCPSRTREEDLICAECKEGAHGSFRGKRY